MGHNQTTERHFTLISFFFQILQLNFEVPHKTLNHKQIIIYETAQAG